MTIRQLLIDCILYPKGILDTIDTDVTMQSLLILLPKYMNLLKYSV